MAEVLFEKILEERGVRADWRVESAGVWAYGGAPATGHAQTVVAERGLDLSKHRSQSTSPQLVMQFDLFVVMEEAHRVELRTLFPGIANRLYTLRELAGESGDFDDPVGGDLKMYRDTAEELSDLINKAFTQILRITNVD
jgi:protein-tyrosine-phosphatase